MAFKNYYDILGIDDKATTEQIREGYRKVAAKYKSGTNVIDEYHEDMLKSINEAIEILSNPEKKKEYDSTLNILDSVVTITPASVQQPLDVNVSSGDAERISELIKKHFEEEKILREKHQSLLSSQSAKPARYFTSVKVIMCMVIVGIAFYFHSPHHFQFDFGDTKKENFTYEYYTKDTTLIYAKPDLKKSKILKGVSKGTGFNVITETTYFFKIAYLNEEGRNIEGYIKKEELEKSTEIPF